MNKKIYFPSAVVLMLLAIYSFKSSDIDYTKTELYFGLSKPDGRNVTNEEFLAFTDTVISKFFPEGFSVINLDGKWYDPEKQKTISEESRLVVRLSKMNDEVSANIDTIRAKYKRYFNQQAVLRVDQKVDVSF
ncbi:MAG TPA: DUF3574 domain-containing protein [Ignavibacteria bacterium]|jgi:hypothetical protein